MNRYLSTAIGSLAILALLAGCSGDPEHEYRTVTINGNVNMVAGPMPAGALHFRLYNLWYLDGVLRHSLEEIEDFTSDSANFSHSFEYPLHKGTGLAVHVWLDADGDGIFCTPQSRIDPAGLTAMEETPDGEINVQITLAENCRAANYFYPPKTEKAAAEQAQTE
jgi:hypothetical protein